MEQVCMSNERAEYFIASRIFDGFLQKAVSGLQMSKYAPNISRVEDQLKTCQALRLLDNISGKQLEEWLDKVLTVWKKEYKEL